MMPRRRLKLPPYGKRLVEMRNAGNHPERVWVIVGKDWSRLPSDNPSLCIPHDYTPGVFDYSLLVGLRVEIVWRSGDAITPAVEMMPYASPIIVHWISNDDDWPYPPGTRMREEILNLFPHLDWSSEQVRPLESWNQDTLTQYLQNRRAYVAALR